jgi:hypothetical protein
MREVIGTVGIVFALESLPKWPGCRAKDLNLVVLLRGQLLRPGVLPVACARS